MAGFELLQINLFPANVPTREHNLFLISSRIHVEKDVVLRIFWLKHSLFIGGKPSLLSVWPFSLHKATKKTTKSGFFFCLVGKRFITHVSCLVVPVCPGCAFAFS